MLGWFRAATAFASCWKRRSRSGSRAKPAGSTLMATSRFNRVSRARYTSPMPPAPSGDWISYGPSLVPTVRVICARNYSLPRKGQRAQEARFRERTAARFESFGGKKRESSGYKAPTQQNPRCGGRLLASGQGPEQRLEGFRGLVQLGQVAGGQDAEKAG